MHQFDVIVVGAGAAGLFCAAQAGQRGLKVLLIDHAPRVAEKIRISGGGRCNFTNRDLDPRQPQRHFVSANPAFARSALARYRPADFIALVEKHGIAHHEKHKGQLFCDHSAQDIITMLLAECASANVTHWQPCQIQKTTFLPANQSASSTGSYQIDCNQGRVQAPNLVVATGGLSIPAIGASDFGYRLAQQFGLPLVAHRPGLVPLTFDATNWAPYAALAGLALPVHIATGHKAQRMAFDEDLLFTHRGLSGPAVLQISSYWQPGQVLEINLAPEHNAHSLADALIQTKAESKKLLPNVLATLVPTRLAELWCSQQPDWQRPINQVPDKALTRLAQQLTQWQLTPSGSEGYRKAEVTLGGVATQALSQQTMESKQQPGLYFIGEVVDMAGWLGGYNFQWAWASAHACAQALQASPAPPPPSTHQARHPNGTS